MVSNRDDECGLVSSLTQLCLFTIPITYPAVPSPLQLNTTIIAYFLDFNPGHVALVLFV